jgi:hypothetical protein
MPRTAEFDRKALAALLDKQHEVAARGQLDACGVSQAVMRYRSRDGGPWQAILPGVYLTRTGDPSGQQREMAALLYAGPDGVLTGSAALRRFGLTAGAQPYRSRTAQAAVAAHGQTIDVLVPPRTRRGGAAFVRLHRTIRLPEQICVDGEIRFVLPPRAVADIVRGLSLVEVRAVVAEAVQRNTCTIAQLAEELAAGPMRGSARFRQVLAGVGDGIRSVAEGDLRDLIVWARLPVPLYNPRLFVGREFLATPDCWWPDFGVAAEVDSRAWHLSPQDWEETLARHARMSAQGIVVLHFTPSQIKRDGKTLASNLRSALAAGRPIPQIRTLPARPLHFS